MTHPQQLHFGIKTRQSDPYEDILRTWQEADEIPSIESAWLFDHPMPIMRADPSGPMHDGWTLLAALAAQTQRLRLGLMVASNANQTPPQLAKRAATVDIISHGRLEFGFGAGGSVEREHTAYGTPLLKPGESIRRLGEACEIIKGMWTQPVFDFAGRYYQLKEIYCEPKLIQKPMPPFIIGGVGEQLTLRVVARHADAWNFPYPDVEQFKRLNGILDGYCAEIGRDPALLMRSVQLIIDPKEDVAVTRQLVQSFIDAGAAHLVLGLRAQGQGIAHWLAEEIIEPLREGAAR